MDSAASRRRSSPSCDCLVRTGYVLVNLGGPRAEAFGLTGDAIVPMVRCVAVGAAGRCQMHWRRPGS